jgi:peptidyl-prolyl cis-trans isomerase SurA
MKHSVREKIMRIFEVPYSFWILFLGLHMSVLAASSAVAQQTDTTMGIAAVVNEDVITGFDIQSRMGLYLITSGLQNTLELQQSLLPQIIDTLVEERLKIQEAERLELETTEEEIRNAITSIEARNGMRPGDFRTLLEEQGIDAETFYGQIEADVAWNKVVREVLQREVNIAPEEVDTVLNKMRANQGKPESLVAEIDLPVSSPAVERDVRQLAEELVRRARSGAAFFSLAQQFSQSPTAAVGGDLGWVLPGELDRQLDRIVASMEPNEISDPVRTGSGYHILMLQNRRPSSAPNPMRHILELSQIYLPTLGGRALSAEQLARYSNRVQTEVRNCEQMNRMAEEIGGPGSGQRPLMYAGSLPENVRNVAVSLPPERISQPVEVGGARLFLIICHREDHTGLPAPQEIHAQLENEKLQNLARQKLLDLRRQALIDIRV